MITAIFAWVTVFPFIVITTLAGKDLMFPMVWWQRYSLCAIAAAYWLGNFMSGFAVYQMFDLTILQSEKVPLWVALVVSIADILLGTFGLIIAVKFRSEYVNNLLTVALRIFICLLLATGALVFLVVLPEVI
jgi:hypothetical protein